MLPLIVTLSALLQTEPFNHTVTKRFFQDLAEYYVPVGGKIELRSPIGELPSLLSSAVHESQKRSIVISTGESRRYLSRKKFQIIVIKSEQDLLRLDSIGASPLADSRIAILLPHGLSLQQIQLALRPCQRDSFGICMAMLPGNEPEQNSYDFYYAAAEFLPKRRCIAQHGTPKRINRWVYKKGFEREKAISFPEVKDFKGCRLTIVAAYQQPYFYQDKFPLSSFHAPLTDFSGIDVAILDIIAKKNNFTATVLVKSPRTSEANSFSEMDELENTPRHGSDAFISAFQSRADVVAGGLVPTYWRYDRMDMTRSYCGDSFRWYMTADEDVTWHRITNCFSSDLWILLGVSFCATCVVRLLVASKEYDSYPILTLWCFVTESGRHPKYRSLSEYILATAFIVLAVPINIAYKAGLATSLSAGIVYTDITVQELYKSDYTLLVPTVITPMIEELLKDHRGERVTCGSDKYVCLREMRRGHRKALLTSSNIMMIERLVRFKDTKTGQPMIREIKGSRPVLNFPIQMYMTKGHRLKKVFDKSLGVLTDAGIPLRLIYDIRFQAARKFRESGGSSDEEEDRPLNFYQLEGAFTLLIAGLCAASVVALAEVLSLRVTGNAHGVCRTLMPSTSNIRSCMLYLRDGPERRGVIR